jgi:hypothetical protein
MINTDFPKKYKAIDCSEQDDPVWLQTFAASGQSDTSAMPERSYEAMYRSEMMRRANSLANLAISAENEHDGAWYVMLIASTAPSESALATLLGIAEHPRTLPALAQRAKIERMALQARIMHARSDEERKLLPPKPIRGNYSGNICLRLLADEREVILIKKKGWYFAEVMQRECIAIELWLQDIAATGITRSLDVEVMGGTELDVLEFKFNVVSDRAGTEPLDETVTVRRQNSGILDIEKTLANTTETRNPILRRQLIRKAVSFTDSEHAFFGIKTQLKLGEEYRFWAQVFHEGLHLQNFPFRIKVVQFL